MMGWGKKPPRGGPWSEGQQLRPDLWPCPVSVGSTIDIRGVQLHERAFSAKAFLVRSLADLSSDRCFCARVVEQESAEPRRKVVGLEGKGSATQPGRIDHGGQSHLSRKD